MKQGEGGGIEDILYWENPAIGPLAIPGRKQSFSSLIYVRIGQEQPPLKNFFDFWVTTPRKMAKCSPKIDFKHIPQHTYTKLLGPGDRYLYLGLKMPWLYYTQNEKKLRNFVITKLFCVVAVVGVKGGRFICVRGRLKCTKD